MASITIRRLDDDLKKRLRLRAARNGRSMEDEVRIILGGAAADPAAAMPPGRSTATPATRSRAKAAPAAMEPTSADAADHRRVLLIIGGGIAAYKSLDLIRRLRERGATVRCILTAAAQEFVTPLAAGALSGDRGLHRPVRSRERVRRRPHPAGARRRSDRGRAGDRRPDGQDGGRPCRRSRHRRAARDRPAGADRAGDEPAHVGPSRRRGATSRSLPPTASPWSGRTRARWRSAAKPASAAWRSRSRSSPRSKPCSDAGRGATHRPLAGRRVIVTSGPTHEPIDPVRYIANRSSGKQGHAIAAAAAAAGAEVVLVSRSGQYSRSARRQGRQGRDRARDAARGRSGAAGRLRGLRGRGRGLARRGTRPQKIKKARVRHRSWRWSKIPTSSRPSRTARSKRPRLVIGFAAETENVVANAKDKLKRKGCDWIVANDVSPATGIMGGDTQPACISSPPHGVESWPPQSKDEVARALIERIAVTLALPEKENPAIDRSRRHNKKNGAWL